MTITDQLASALKGLLEAYRSDEEETSAQIDAWIEANRALFNYREIKEREYRQWQPIEDAPKDGTMIIGWFVPNEVDCPQKSKPWLTRWELQQWKDGTGEKVGKPFGLWITNGWKEPLSYAPTHWTRRPTGCPYPLPQR